MSRSNYRASLLLTLTALATACGPTAEISATSGSDRQNTASEVQENESASDRSAPQTFVTTRDSSAQTSQSSPSVDTTAPPITVTPTHVTTPLDEVPGFGATNESFRRDNRIALYQEYERQLVIQGCMVDRGFDSYAVEVAFPEDAALRVLDQIRTSRLVSELLPTDASFAGSRNSRNTTIFLALEGEARDAYAQARWGISAQEALSGETKPDLVSDGGCEAYAWRVVPSLWSLSRELAEEIRQLGIEVQDQAMAGEPGKRLAVCASEAGITAPFASPVELDELAISVATDSPGSSVMEDTGACLVEWDRSLVELRSSAEAHFIDANQDRIQQHVAEHNAVFVEAEADDDFVSYLLGLEDNSVDQMRRLELEESEADADR